MRTAYDKNVRMNSDAAMRLEEAAMIVAALARQWRETAEKDDSGLISRDRVDQIIAMTETTARNLVKLAASRLPDEWSCERPASSEDVDGVLDT